MKSAIGRFGSQLKLVREARGYTQKQLAEIIGVSETAAAKLERGEQGVRWKVMEEIFAKLGEPSSYYFSENRPPMPSPVITAQQALQVLAAEVGQPRLVVVPSPVARLIAEIVDDLPCLNEDKLKRIRGLIDTMRTAISDELEKPV